MKKPLVLFALCFAIARPALAQDLAVEGRTLTVTPAEGAASAIEISCDGTSALAHGGLIYVACGSVGVLILEAGSTPKEVGTRNMGGDVTGLFVRGETVWAEFVTRQAQPVAAGGAQDGPIIVEGRDPGPSTAVPPAAEAAPSTHPEGTVVEVSPDFIVVSLGSKHGVARNDRIEIFVRREVQIGGETTAKEERVLVGTVTAVSPQRAEVSLGVNERVPEGALARPTESKTTSNPVLPPRLGGLWEFGFTARPFLALGTFGFGTISDATIRRRLDGPWSIEARIEPLGIGLADEGNVVALSGNFIGSYDTRYFSVGLGAGWAAINDNLDDASASFDASPEIEPTRFDEVKSGLSIAQSVRLGSVDGMHLSVFNTFLLYRDEFNYGGTTAAGQFPVREGVWLLIRGGGGAATGYAFGELGLRVRVLGAGDSGSLFLSPSVGGGGLSGERKCDYYDGCVESVSYGGPLVGLGVEWRQ
jgi:hypothetical protein